MLIFLEISLTTLAVTLTAVLRLSLYVLQSSDPAAATAALLNFYYFKLLPSVCQINISAFVLKYLRPFMDFFICYLFHHFLFYRDESFVCQGHGGGSVVVVV